MKRQTKKGHKVALLDFGTLDTSYWILHTRLTSDMGRRRGRIRSRMFIETIAGTTIHTIEDTSNEEDPHVYNHISNPSYNQLYKYMAI